MKIAETLSDVDTTSVAPFHNPVEFPVSTRQYDNREDGSNFVKNSSNADKSINLIADHAGVHVSQCVVIMSTRDRPFLPGYLSSVDGKKQHIDKLAIIGDLDPYETVRSEWLHDIDL